MFRHILAIALALPALSGATMVFLTPPSLTIANGTDFEIDVFASDVGIGAFDFDLTFESAVLSLNNLSFDLNLGAPLSIQDWTAGVGIVNFAEISFLNSGDLALLQTGTYRLAQLFFTASGVGTSQLTISRSVVSDADRDLIMPSLVGAVVMVTSPGATVPEPGTAGCVLFALTSLALYLVRTTKLR